MNTNYSPLPLIVAGAPRGQQAFVHAGLLPGQKDWVELFTDDLEAVVGEVLTATVLVDEIEIEIAVDSLHVMALAGRLPLRKYARMETSLVLPQESVAVRLVVDFQPEPGHAYEYEDKFSCRLIFPEGIYLGAGVPEKVERWMCCSAGFWFGATFENELIAIFVRVMPEEAGFLLAQQGRSGMFRRAVRKRR